MRKMPTEPQALYATLLVLIERELGYIMRGRRWFAGSLLVLVARFSTVSVAVAVAVSMSDNSRLVHESRSVTIRLRTGAPGRASTVSTTK